MRLYADGGKRVVDLTIALGAMVLLSPVMTAVALSILLVNGRPVLFQQWRPGRHGRLFRLTKFRTMAVDTGADGRPLGDAARLTRLGAFLRSMSLDELPQFWHVLNGTMSLVGPRPLLPEYLPLYSPQQARRHEVRPGITGLAQVTGRNYTDWETRLRLDVEYVDRLSWRLDLQIIIATIIAVCRREGISHPEHATMEKFQGTKHP